MFTQNKVGPLISLTSMSLISTLLLIPSIIKADETISKKSVSHFVEANISANYIFTGGDRLNNETSFASGFNIAHGSNITPVHTLVLAYGKDYMQKNNATLTSKSLFLRRYMKKKSTSNFSPFSIIGSATYTYETPNTRGVLENAGIIIGIGTDWLYSKKISISFEADYRGFVIKQFGENTIDYIRPVTLFVGLKYHYLTTHY